MSLRALLPVLLSSYPPIEELETVAILYQRTQEALRDSEIRFQTLIQQSLQGILIHDQHQPLCVNQALATLFGYTRPEDILSQATILPLIAPQDRARIMAYCDAFARGDAVSAQWEYQGLRQDGTPIWVEARATAIVWGGATVMLSVHIDMTARQQAATALARYDLLAAQTRDIILFLRPDGQIMDANQAAAAAYGYDRATLLLMTIADLRGPTTLPLLDVQLAQANQGGICFETLHRRQDGSLFPVEVSSTGANLGGERLLLHIVRDITERKQAEAMREQLAAIVASSEEAIIGESLEGIIMSWNRGAEQLYGYTAAEVLGQPLSLLLPPGVPDDFPQSLARLQRGAGINQYETQRLRKDGTRLDVALTRSLIHDSTGQVIGVSSIARDLRTRKRAEAALQHACAALEQCIEERTMALYQERAMRQHLEAILSSIGDAFVVLDRQWRYTYVNDHAVALLGRRREDLLGQNVWDLFPEIRDELPGQELHRALATQQPVSFEYFNPLWQRWFENRVFPTPDGVSVFFADISARKQAEEALHTLTTTLDQRVQERTALLTLIQQVTRAANEAPTSAAAMQYALDLLCAYTDWPIGHVYMAVAPEAKRWAPTSLWHLDDSMRFSAFQQATQALELAAGEGLIGRVGASGEPEWLRDVATALTFRRQQAAQEAGLATAVAWPIKVGFEVAGVLEFYTTEPLAPNPAMLEAMTQVSTQLGRSVERERAAAQAQRQQEALIQREKLAAMGTLLASVAHELNNPLAVILMQAALLQAEAGSGPQAEYAADLTEAATRCERLVRTFLTLSRQHVPERTAVALNALLTDTLELLAPTMRVEDIAVELRLAADLPLLWADVHQLQQVLVNLLTNAQHAVRDVAPPRQVTVTTQWDPARSCVTLEVADTGPGMPSRHPGTYV